MRKQNPTRTHAEDPNHSDSNLGGVEDLDQFHNSCVKIRLRPINIEATHGNWDRLAAMEEFAALFPEYAHGDPDPESYTVYLRRTPDTHHLNASTIRQHQGFPENILLPTMAAVAASPPRPSGNNNNNNNPPTNSHTNRLLAFANSILHRRPTAAETVNEDNPDDENHSHTTGETRNRNSPPGTPPPNKRPAQSWSDNEDPYDDGTNWQHVVAASPYLRSPPTEPNDNSDDNDNVKPPATTNQFAPLADTNQDHNHTDDDDSDNAMETEEEGETTDGGSQPLLGTDSDNQQSGATADEMETIVNYVRTHNPSRLPDIQRYLHNIRSFSTDQDAQDAWDYAQSLLQAGPPTVAGTRTGHVDPHERMGQRAE